MDAVIIGLDFIPSNGKLYCIEMNTNIGLTDVTLPYFDMDALVEYISQNAYNKVTIVKNKDAYSVWGPQMEQEFQKRLDVIDVQYELYSSDYWPSPIPELSEGPEHLVIRLAFDVESPIDVLTEDKREFRNFMIDNGLGEFLPRFNDEIPRDIDNGDYPDVVVKDPLLDKMQGITFYKLTDKNRNEVFANEYVEEYIVSDALSGGKNIVLRAYLFISESDILMLRKHLDRIIPIFDLESDHDQTVFDRQFGIGPYGSFLKGTPVKMADGTTKNIEDVNLGDKLMSLDIPGMPDENDPVQTWIAFNTNSLVGSKTTSSTVISKITTYSYGYIIINDDLNVVLLARIFRKSADGVWGFVLANDLRAGDMLLNSKMEEVPVTKMEIIYDVVEAYTFDVEPIDTYFGGDYFIMVHNMECFVSGTQIAMADGTTKNIEDVKLGDRALGYSDGEVVEDVVVELQNSTHSKVIEIQWRDSKNINTIDHPYLVDGKGWCSYHPEITKDRHNLDCEKLVEGDMCFKIHDGEIIKEPILKIMDVQERRHTYLLKMKDHHTFFANSILVHNKS